MEGEGKTTTYRLDYKHSVSPKLSTQFSLSRKERPVEEKRDNFQDLANTTVIKNYPSPSFCWDN